jgi:hypothetical protein
MKLDLLTNAGILDEATDWIAQKKKQLEQGQPIEQPPQENEQDQQEEQEPEMFNKTF